jgi:hypothetical protein
VPENAKAVRSFLGLTSYYRRYIPNYATIASPLYNLYDKKKSTFKWLPEHQAAFDRLKCCVAHKVTLSFPDYKLPFTISTDASSVGIAGVLSQVIDNYERPIAFTSRVLTKSERNYSTFERELLDVIYSLQQFKPYIWGQRFDLYTDHAALTWLKTVKHPNKRLVAWLEDLAEYHFDIKYKRGLENVNADALSRAPVQPVVQTTSEKFINAITALDRK